MRYLLNVVYLILVAAASPWLLWSALRRGKYRGGLPQKLLGLVSPRLGNRPCIWLHAVSLGEVNLLAPLLAQIERRRPELECVISTTTLTGFEQARRKYKDHCVFYCPLDFSWAVEEAMRRVRPSMLVLAELELWPNLISAARRHGASVAVVNGRLSEKSLRGYRRVRPLISRLLRQVDVIAAQTQTYREGFIALGALPEKTHAVGSMKFDGAETDRGNRATRHFADLAGIAEKDIVLLAGSTQEPEETMILEVYRSLSVQWPALKLLIAPRHPERFDAVATLLAKSGLRWRRRTELGRAASESPASILLIDSVGELAAWWGLARIAFVGGSMGTRGGQNMIEPAAYGAAVSFGPKTRNFRDVVALLLSGDAAVVVQDRHELAAFVRKCLTDESYRDALGGKAQTLVLNQLGAAARTWGLLESVLDKRRLNARAA